MALGTAPAAEAARFSNVDGDGLGYLLVGDPETRSRGAFLVLGHRGFRPMPFNRLGTSGRRYVSPPSGRIQAVAGHGDLDGDGRPELGFGTPDARGGRGAVLILRSR